MKKLFILFCFSFISVFAYSQWEWQNPLPQGNTLSSVWFTDANTGYAVGGDYGIGGTILKTLDGGITWSTLSIGTTNQLHSVTFADANNGFAVGENGTILKNH